MACQCESSQSPSQSRTDLAGQNLSVLARSAGRGLGAVRALTHVRGQDAGNLAQLRVQLAAHSAHVLKLAQHRLAGDLAAVVVAHEHRGRSRSRRRELR